MMRLIASAGGIEIRQGMSGSIVVFDSNSAYLYDAASAYEAIREVKDTSIRAALLAQWNADIARQRNAEDSTLKKDSMGWRESI